MTDDAPRCGVCEQVTGPHGHVCDPCTSRTVRQLGTIPTLITELDNTITRQHRFRSADSRVRGTTETLVPFHIAASQARTDLRDVLRREATLVAEAATGVRTLPPVTTQAAAGFLAGMADWITARPAGPDFVDKIAQVIDRAWTVVDRPTDRRYVGSCPVTDCTGTLYQHGTRATARCSACFGEVEAAPLRDAMFDRLAEMLFTASECERLTAEYGQRVDARKVRVWASRGRLVAQGDGAPRYRLADVLALAGAA